jgi:hypothetical protein
MMLLSSAVLLELSFELVEPVAPLFEESTVLFPEVLQPNMIAAKSSAAIAKTLDVRDIASP